MSQSLTTDARTTVCVGWHLWVSESGEQFTVTLMNPKATDMGLLKYSLLHPPHTFIQGWVRKMDNQFSKSEAILTQFFEQKKFQFCPQKQSNIRTPTPEQILFWWENYSLHKGDRIDLWNILPQKSFFFYCLMYLYLSQSCIHPAPPKNTHICEYPETNIS